MTTFAAIRRQDGGGGTGSVEKAVADAAGRPGARSETERSLAHRSPRRTASLLFTLRPMGDWIQAYVLRVSRVLEHRLASFLGTAVILLLLGDSIRRVLPEDEQGGVLMWIWIGLGAYGGIATVYWVQRGPESGRLFIAWFSAITPALCGMAAAFAGSSVFVMWVGILLSIGLVGWVAAATRTGPEA